MDSLFILVPTAREAAFFADHGLRAEICGVGPAECAAFTAHLLATRKPDLVLLAGIAGSYTDRLSTGDTVAVASETTADLGRRSPEGAFTPMFSKSYSATFLPVLLPTVHSNTVSTAGGLIGTYPPLPQPSAAENMEGSEATIENMEGAAFFAVCERLGVAAAEVRTISNRVGEPVTAENLDLAARRLAASIAEIAADLAASFEKFVTRRPIP